MAVEDDNLRPERNDMSFAFYHDNTTHDSFRATNHVFQQLLNLYIASLHIKLLGTGLKTPLHRSSGPTLTPEELKNALGRSSYYQISSILSQKVRTLSYKVFSARHTSDALNILLAQSHCSTGSVDSSHQSNCMSFGTLFLVRCSSYSISAIWRKIEKSKPSFDSS